MYGSRRSSAAVDAGAAHRGGTGGQAQDAVHPKQHDVSASADGDRRRAAAGCCCAPASLSGWVRTADGGRGGPVRRKAAAHARVRVQPAWGRLSRVVAAAPWPMACGLSGVLPWVRFCGPCTMRHRDVSRTAA